MATSAVALAPAPVDTGLAPWRVGLIGNPNTGKTTIFNRLCGARAKTSNFPGTTTTLRRGRSELESARTLDLLDLPGVYAVALECPESQIARSVIAGEGPFGRPDVMVVLVDACNLTRNLVLVAELLQHDVAVVVALNMVDLAARRRLKVGADRLAVRLGVPVVSMVARTGQGIDELKRAIASAVTGGPRVRPMDLPQPGASVEILSAWADRVADDVVEGQQSDRPLADNLTARLDPILMHPVFGLLAFAAVMGGLFWTLFALATVPMDLIELTFSHLGALVTAYMPAGPVRDLTTEGIIGGIAGTVVFLPQICLLFFLISLLEDTGYLARAAFVMDRVLRRFGLPGHAFVPLLTSHACALPGIMSARLISNRRDRLATIMVAPFMSCSARLPVYVLLTSLLFARRPGLAALAFVGCYLVGAAAAMFTAKLFGRTVLKGSPIPMVLELPTYKRPSLSNALLTAKDQGLSFLRTAGTVIMAICVVMWWLSAYPRTDPPAEAVALRAEAVRPGVPAHTVADLTNRADALEARAAQSASFAGRIGRTVQPLFAPLGYDWQLSVGVLTSFLAREVFVSTMSVLVGVGDSGDVDAGVTERIGTMKRDDGGLVFTQATSASALVFFVLAMQCLPTLAVTRKETGSLKYAVLQLGYMSGLAYAAAFVLRHALIAAGVS
jgi:ferrous iron transport protein B